MKIQVLGICRFSLLVDGGFQVVHETLDDRRRMLYDPERLKLRFLWFERVCLPPLAAQTDPNFKLIVLTGTDFPKPWLDRLNDVTAGLSQIEIVQEEPSKHRVLCRSVIRKRVDRSADVIAQFRQDDDDAVAVDYVERVRSDFTRKLFPLFEAHPLLSADYSRGLTLSAEKGKVEVLPRISHNQVSALTIYMKPGHRRSVLDYGHHKLASYMPGVTFQDSVMNLRGKHGTNDGRDPARSGYGWSLDEAEHAAVLMDRFRIDLPAFRTAVAGL